MVDAPYLLVPPSLGQRSGAPTRTHSGAFDDELAPARNLVVSALRRALRLSRSKLEVLFGARGELLTQAIVANREVVNDTASRTAAWQRFDGVVWTHLDPASLSRVQRDRLLVPSALYGVLRANDPVAMYRLGFSVSLAPIGSLAKFWRPHVSNSLERVLDGTTVIDLLPKEHAAAVDFDRLAEVALVRRVFFVSHDGARSVGHDAKAVKAKVARQILIDGWESLEGSQYWGWHCELNGNDAVVRAPRQRQPLN